MEPRPQLLKLVGPHRIGEKDEGQIAVDQGSDPATDREFHQIRTADSGGERDDTLSVRSMGDLIEQIDQIGGRKIEGYRQQPTSSRS